ncbi:hypothetical protein ECE50_020960 [Chitinophaga sp. Mgbs1]|uniref:Uncharacterized protein n=1 Tax=Chitinophaga solisilvae TaxID=1233460 RepID=A0A3S1JJR8_9BACT|nr:hypothetical protein [Chitinophaga solisilvae]
MTSNKAEINMLLDIHTTFSKLPVTFRELVSEECNWSIPTFYRKMRGRDKADPNNKGRIIPALSKAEKEAIIRKTQVVYQELTDFLEKYSTN